MQLVQAYRNVLPHTLLNLLYAAAIVAGILVLVTVAVGAIAKRRRHHELVRRFGEEYSLAVEDLGSEAAADRELAARETRVHKLDVRRLSTRQRARVSEQWVKVQAMFVDNPWGAVRSATTLIKTVMQQRGYPSADFEQRLMDLSVDHAHIVQHYRAARALSEVDPDEPGTTESLRQAMVHYRAIVEELSEPTALAAARWREAHAT